MDSSRRATLAEIKKPHSFYPRFRNFRSHKWLLREIFKGVSTLKWKVFNKFEYVHESSPILRKFRLSNYVHLFQGKFMFLVDLHLFQVVLQRTRFRRWTSSRRRPRHHQRKIYRYVRSFNITFSYGRWRLECRFSDLFKFIVSKKNYINKSSYAEEPTREIVLEILKNS